jgi:Na+-transporting NADH:ubiquinone oxidoreductase subunit NqrB
MLTVAVNETLLAAAPVVMVSLRNRRGVLSYPWRALWRWAAASGASVLVAHYLFLAIGIGSATGRAMQFLWALCGGGSAAILTFAVAYLLDADGAREVVTTLVARMRLPARFA